MQLPGQLLKHQNTVSRQSADKVREIPTGKPASNTAFDCYFVRNDLHQGMRQTIKCNPTPYEVRIPSLDTFFAQQHKILLELSFVEKDVGLA